MYSRSGVAFFCNVNKVCTKDPNVRISYRSSLRRDARTSFFTLFLEGFSDPRVYRYPIYHCSEVFFFLQRQKSVFKKSYRVRGMGPPQGPAFACTVTTINKTKQEKLKKKHKFSYNLGPIKHVGARCENAACLIVPGL